MPKLTCVRMFPAIPLIALCVGLSFGAETGWAQAHHDHGQATTAASSGPTPSAPGAVVYFVDVKSGETLQPKTVMHFGLRNMGVAPAGTARPNSGHHHLLIDTDLPPLDQPIPSDENHLHFGAGQTEAEVALAPGEHVLQLLLADKDHIPHNPPVMSDKIRVKVVDGSKPIVASGLTPSTPGAAVYFVDVKSGDTLQTKTVMHFGLRKMGVAPAGTARPNSGHHHLLIDADLPSLDQPIPSDENHLHFGAGQTEAEVALAPGEHVLQLLLADKDHIPHNPPVMSDKIRVKVVDGKKTVANTAGGRTPSPPKAKVYFAQPENGACVSEKPVIRFGLIGMGVAPAGFSKPNTGHHHIILDAALPPFDQPIPNDENHLHFGSGQTEAEISLTPGKHTLQLLLADENHVPHNPPVYSSQIEVTVGCKPRKARRRHRRRYYARY